MQRHQPANWVSGDSQSVTVLRGRTAVPDLYWFHNWLGCEWFTEGELEIMVINQLNAFMFADADKSGMMLTSVQVYDEWFDGVKR